MTELFLVLHNETYLWLLLKDDNTTPFVSSG